MRILKKLSEFGQVGQGCVLTIGNFDGVHVGHQEILRTARRIAEDRGVELVVMTFEPHPVAILHPEKAPGVLTPLPLKLHLLEDYADHCVIVLEDSRALLKLAPEQFVDEFLMASIRPAAIVEGDDFHFGAGRTGDVKMLAQFGRRRGFEIVVVPPRQIELATGQVLRVSSTIIRYMLESGHVAEAAGALSRPYRLIGPIVSGWGRGRQLGFPTLNLGKTDQVLPAEGVYAGFVETAATEDELLPKQEHLPAVFSIGQARTFGEEYPLLIEAHLLTGAPGSPTRNSALGSPPKRDESRLRPLGNVGDLTGQWMAMDFVEHLRSQHKFHTPEELVAQIAKDCGAARKILEV